MCSVVGDVLHRKNTVGYCKERERESSRQITGWGCTYDRITMVHSMGQGHTISRRILKTVLETCIVDRTVFCIRERTKWEICNGKKMGWEMCNRVRTG